MVVINTAADKAARAERKVHATTVAKKVTMPKIVGRRQKGVKAKEAKEIKARAKDRDRKATAKAKAKAKVKMARKVSVLLKPPVQVIRGMVPGRRTRSGKMTRLGGKKVAGNKMLARI